MTIRISTEIGWFEMIETFPTIKKFRKKSSTTVLLNVNICTFAQTHKGKNIISLLEIKERMQRQ